MSKSDSSPPQSKSSKSKSLANKQMEDNIAQFCGVTGASWVTFIGAERSWGRASLIDRSPCDLHARRVKDAKRFLDKYKRVDIAMDAFYNDPSAMTTSAKHLGGSSGPSTSKLNTLFDKYKGM